MGGNDTPSAIQPIHPLTDQQTIELYGKIITQIDKLIAKKVQMTALNEAKDDLKNLYGGMRPH